VNSAGKSLKRRGVQIRYFLQNYKNCMEVLKKFNKGGFHAILNPQKYGHPDMFGPPLVANPESAYTENHQFELRNYFKSHVEMKTLGNSI
jgi:hypothetical protein